MTYRLNETPTTNLGQLLGAPVVALVEAEAAAIQATVEFIQRVGFESGPLVGQDLEAAGRAQPRLRMTTFRYPLPGSDGKRQVNEVQIPTLSLVPIPSLQIDSATLELAVRVLDARILPAAALTKGSPATCNFPGEERLDLRVQMGSLSSSAGKGLSTNLKVKIEVGRPDVPSGLSRLFNLMDQSGSIQASEEQHRSNRYGC